LAKSTRFSPQGHGLFFFYALCDGFDAEQAAMIIGIASSMLERAGGQWPTDDGLSFALTAPSA
jgi:hypothetical protein